MRARSIELSCLGRILYALELENHSLLGPLQKIELLKVAGLLFKLDLEETWGESP